MLVDTNAADTLVDMADSRDSGPIKLRSIQKGDGRLKGRKELSPAAADRTRQVFAELLRKHKNNKAALSRALSISATAVLNIEKGGGISRETALAIAKAAGVAPVELLGEEELHRLGLTANAFPNLEACLAYHGTHRWTPAAIAAARAGAFADDVSPSDWATRLDKIAAALDAAAASRKN